MNQPTCSATRQRLDPVDFDRAKAHAEQLRAQAIDRAWHRLAARVVGLWSSAVAGPAAPATGRATTKRNDHCMA